jgi:death on curing protein
VKSPIWVPRIVVETTHFEQIREHGGLPGIRDESLLESALTRPQQKWSYSKRPQFAELAAAYCYGILRSHPFNDGNKRVAFLTMVVFLGLNGLEFNVEETEVVSIILDAAASKLSESDLTDWIKDHISK